MTEYAALVHVLSFIPYVLGGIVVVLVAFLCFWARFK